VAATGVARPGGGLIARLLGRTSVSSPLELQKLSGSRGLIDKKRVVAAPLLEAKPASSTCQTLGLEQIVTVGEQAEPVERQGGKREVRHEPIWPFAG